MENLDGSVAMVTASELFLDVTFFAAPAAHVDASTIRTSGSRSSITSSRSTASSRRGLLPQYLQAVPAHHRRREHRDTLPTSPPVRAFNSVLTTACALDKLEVGVACMRSSEHAFAGIPALIGRAVERGWVPANQLVRPVSRVSGCPARHTGDRAARHVSFLVLDLPGGRRLVASENSTSLSRSNLGARAA